MKIELSIQELKFIKESLKYTIHKFENYEHPSYELKCRQLDEAKSVQAKVSEMIQELKKCNFQNNLF